MDASKVKNNIEKHINLLTGTTKEQRREVHLGSLLIGRWVDTEDKLGRIEPTEEAKNHPLIMDALKKYEEQERKFLSDMLYGDPEAPQPMGFMDVSSLEQLTHEWGLNDAKIP